MLVREGTVPCDAACMSCLDYAAGIAPAQDITTHLMVPHQRWMLVRARASPGCRGDRNSAERRTLGQAALKAREAARAAQQRADAVLEAAAAGALSVRDAEAALAALKAGAPSGRAAAATLLGLASGGDQAAPPGDGAGAGRGRLRWPGPGLAAMP